MKATPSINAAAVSADFEFAALGEAIHYREALVREMLPVLHGRVIEVGAGIGQMTALFQQAPEVRELVAVEPDTRFHAQFAAANPAIRLVTGTVADLSREEAPAWDGLVAINVLEHIQDDAGELVQWATLLRARQGRLGLFVPARPEIYAPIDGDFGHYRRYTKPGLRRLLEGAGFAVERLCYFNWVGYFAWWLTFCVLGRREFNPRAVRFFDRRIFPIVNTLETRLCRPPFGQSLVAIARVNPV